MTNKEILQSLRYCSDPDYINCTACKYFCYGDCLKRLVADAADLIERLTAENAALREKQRWMPEELILVNVVWVNRAPESYYEKIKDVSFSGTACFYRENWYWDSPVVLDLLAEYGKDDPDLVDDAV